LLVVAVAEALWAAGVTVQLGLLLLPLLLLPAAGVRFIEVLAAAAEAAATGTVVIAAAVTATVLLEYGEEQLQVALGIPRTLVKVLAIKAVPLTLITPPVAAAVAQVGVIKLAIQTMVTQELVLLGAVKVSLN
jgi:hypothetical protein